MATDRDAKRKPPPYQQTAPVTQQVVVQQPTANIKYVDQYGNPVAPPVQTQQVVVVQQPQPNIGYVDQNGNPVAPPQQVQQLQVQVQPAQPEQVVTNANANQLALGGGNCWRVTLIVLWSITLVGGIPQLIMGAFILNHYDRRDDSDYWYDDDPSDAYTLALLLPGIVGIIGGSISIYGVNIYNYTLTVIGAILSGILLCFGLLLFTVDYGAFMFIIFYIPPFVLYSCLFAFSIVFAKHISYVKKNGHPDPNTCGNCSDGCDCCGPPTN
jgi:hypothetical protein